MDWIDDGVREDGVLVNAITGLGTKKDKSTGTRVVPQPMLAQTELEALYTTGLPRRVVDLIVIEATRRQPIITWGRDERGFNSETTDDILRAMRSLRLMAKLREVGKLARLYGGACLLLLIDDGRSHEEPVDVDNIRSLKGVVPLSRHQIMPHQAETLFDWEEPEFYQINTSKPTGLAVNGLELGDFSGSQGNFANIKVHATRVLRVDGEYIPWDMRTQNQGWGLSILQIIWESYQGYGTGISSLINILQDFDVFIHKIPGLMEMIRAGREADIRKRMEVNMMARSTYGGMVLDREEDVLFAQRSIASVPEIMDRIITDLVVTTGYPRTVLLGESPAGLGAQGKFEEKSWTQVVEDYRNDYLLEPLRDLLSLLMLSKRGPTQGRMPSRWDVTFDTVFKRTDEEEADYRLRISQLDNTYINLQVLNAQEVRESRFGGANYSGETTLLDGYDPESMKKKALAEQEEQQRLAAQQQLEQMLLQQEVQAGGGAEPTAAAEPQVAQDAADAYLDAVDDAYTGLHALREDGSLDDRYIERFDSVPVYQLRSYTKDWPGVGHLCDRNNRINKDLYDQVVIGAQKESNRFYKVTKLDSEGTPVARTLLAGFGNYRGR